MAPQVIAEHTHITKVAQITANTQQALAANHARLLSTVTTHVNSQTTWVSGTATSTIAETMLGAYTQNHNKLMAAYNQFSQSLTTGANHFANGIGVDQANVTKLVGLLGSVAPTVI